MDVVSDLPLDVQELFRGVPTGPFLVRAVASTGKDSFCGDLFQKRDGLWVVTLWTPTGSRHARSQSARLIMMMEGLGNGSWERANARMSHDTDGAGWSWHHLVLETIVGDIMGLSSNV